MLSFYKLKGVSYVSEPGHSLVKKATRPGLVVNLGVESYSASFYALIFCTKYLYFLEIIDDASVRRTQQNPACNNPGIQPPEAVTAGRFAYYPIS